jgi:FkbM family methyltransferase
MTRGPFSNLRRQIKHLLSKRAARPVDKIVDSSNVNRQSFGTAKQPQSASLSQSPSGSNPEAARIQFEKRARANSKAIYLGNNTCLCRVFGKAMMYVDTRDYGIAAHLMMSGYWESWVSVAMMNELKPGMVAADVGANFGYYSLLMGFSVRPTGRVYAFEPNPHLTKWLTRSVGNSGIRRIATIDGRAAFSETATKLRLFVPVGLTMNGTILEEGRPIPRREGEIIDVTTVRLDDALPAKVDFIKIDAEGAEREIWRGMSRVVAGNPDLRIFMEFNAARRYDPQEFLAQIEKDGFKLAYVGRDGLKKTIDAAQIIARQEELMLYLTR